MKYLIILTLSFCIFSCSTKQRKLPPQKAPAKASQILKKAKKAYGKSRFKTALSHTSKIIKLFPGSDAIDDAYMLRGDVYHSKKDHKNSYENYIQIVNSKLYSPLETQAMYKSARSLVKLFRFNEALSLTNRVLEQENLGTPTRGNVLNLRHVIFVNQGDNLDALKTLNQLTNMKLV